MKALILEEIESITCTSCGARASRKELAQEDVDLINELQRCPMCSEEVDVLEVEGMVINSKTDQPISPTLCGKEKDSECELMPCEGCEAHEMIYQIEKDKQDARLDDMSDLRLSEKARVGL